ncbi:MAG: lamin tail domain-containing protein [Bacteroidetes bacterium]|nr:lamin tail domain-containing protein [Bacteroidota bacterium]
MKKGLLLIASLLVGMSVWGQVSLTNGVNTSTQDFNSLANTGSGITWTENSTLSGWYVKTDATASITTYGTNTGSTTTAGFYSFGTASASDRAVGFAASNTFFGAASTGKGYLGFRIKNNGTTNISSLQVTWTGEEWRKENNAASQNLTLTYQTGATVTDLTSGSWTSASSIFTSPIVGATTATALDGNGVANRVVGINATISVTIAPGSEIMLRWEDLNDAGTDHQLTIDDISINATFVVPNDAPTASAVSFSGTLTQGETLTGAYTYGDTESDPEGTSTFKWYRSNDGAGSGKAAIGGATSSTYVLQAGDVTKFISFEVTPVASTGTATGTAVESAINVSAVQAASNNSPVASSVTFSGTLTEGQLLTGSYSYSDIEGNPEGISTFKWYRSTDGLGNGKTAIGSATSSTYTLQAADISKYISFEVTPVATAGTLTGSPVESALQGAIAALPNDAPVASSVNFTGTLSEGQTLTGSYTYSDTESNPEGTSTFRWLRSDDGSGTNEAAISGATSSTYVLTTSDVNKFISFEVTPVASVGTTTGTAVASTRQGAVTGLPALIFDEPFDYVANGTNGLSVQSGNVWTKFNTGDSIFVTSGGLSVNGFQASAGNKVSFGGTGTDYNRVFTSKSSGTVYFSFMMNVTDLGSLNTGGGYLAGLASSTSNFGATMWLKSSGSDYNIGIAPITGTATYASGTYTVGSTVLVVGSYELIAGIGNDVVKLWVNPAQGTFGAGSEPTPDVTVTNTAGTDLTLVNRFFLRQDSATETPITDIDELKIGTTWAVVTPAGPVNNAPVATSVAFSGTLNVGQLLTGSYTYSDTESDVEGTSTFIWYSSDDGSGTNKAAIGGATSSTYTLVSGDNGKYISFEVTPVATTGITTGTPVESSLQGSVSTPTTVQFSAATSSVAESGGTIDLTVSIANPSGSVATTVEVALTSGTGSAADINTYTTQTVTFPAGSSTSETVTLTVTDDAVMEGSETLGFTLQNVTGGSSATLGAQTTHTLTITDNDNASITLSGSATESSEDASVITVNLTNDTFEPSLTTGNWTVTNLPAGVSKGTLTRVSNTQATIALSGNRTTDYDTNFSPIVTIDHAELVVTASGSVTANSGFTFTASDDAESITIADDGSITEGAESSEVLTITIVGGTLVSSLTPANWTISNQPAGVTFGSPVRVDDTHATITITANRTTDYDANDTDLQISVNQAEIDDYSGGNLTASGVTFTAVIEATPAGFFSEYVEGSSNNKAIEIYNNSESTIDFTAGSYQVELYTNGSATVSTTLNLTGTLAPNDVYVIVNASAGGGLLALADITSGVTGFNGDDALVLKSGSTILDVIGQIGTDPGTQWISGGVSTLDKTLRRKITVTTGDSNGSNVFDPSVEWDVYNIDTFSDLGFPPSQPNPTNGSFSNVTVTDPTTLTGNLTISGTLFISGASLNTGSNSINLGATGSLSGETTTNYIIGTVTANPTLNGSSPVGIAGLGLTINPNGNVMGSTVVTRRTGSAASVLGVGLNRRWTITPNSQPSSAVNVTITWPSSDDNGLNLGNLFIYKSEDNGATWQMHAGPLSTGTDPRSLSFTTTSFSDWTVGDGDSPLPIELLSWTATPGNKKVTLNWETASELNHDGFEIYRSTTTKENFRLFKSYISSNELKPKGNTGGKYSIVDQSVLNMETYHYKLVDVSVDGKRKEHKILTVIPTDGKPVQPGFVVPITFKISSIYPNPFNPTTNLVFDLPSDGLVVIRLYNVIGQEVQVIRNEIMKKGREKVVNITTNGLPSGVYMVSVEFAGQRLTKSLTFLK